MKKKITSLIILFMMIVSAAWGADTMRISALPAVTTITPATAVVPIVDSGLTRKITVTNLLSYVTGGAGTITGTGYNYYIPYWTGSTSLGAITPGTAGYVLTSNGSGSAPSFQAATAGGNVSNSGTPIAYQWPQWQSAQILSGHTVTANRVVCSGTNSVPTACTNLTDTAYGTTTGTGTNHYWPYWTGATTLGARSLTASRPVCTDSSGDPATCTYTPIVTLWNSGTCSGYLKSDGTCDVPGGTGTVTGTGTQYYMPVWNSSSGLGALASLGTSGYVLTSNGAGAAPTWQAVSGTVTGSGTQYYTTYWSSTSGLGSISPGTAGYVLTSNGSGSAPSYQAPTGSVSDTAYSASSWDTVTTVAPSKNAIRDYLESKMPAGADGSYYLQLANNTAISPTAGIYQIYYEGGVAKLGNNGTENALAITIAASTATLGTSQISSGASATVVSVAASGVVSTDVITWSFNGSPVAVTGYAPSASGMLQIMAYPTTGYVNFLVYNNTASAITPGAMTLNWRVVR